MSSTQPAGTQRAEKPARQGMGKLIALGVVGVLIVIFVFQNTVKVKFSFLFWDFTWPAWLMLVITLVTGFVVGLAASAVLRRRKRKELRRRAQAM